MKYVVIETQYNEKNILGTFNNEDEAKEYFNNRVVAFIEGNDDEEISTDETHNYFHAEYDDGEEYELEIVSCDRKYDFPTDIKTIIEDCMSYAYEEEDDEQKEAYNKELTHIWNTLINSGIFHDAIGKTSFATNDSVGVWEEY